MNILNNLPNSLIAHIPLKEVMLQAGIAANARTICENLGRTLLVYDENTKDFVNITGDKIILPGNQKAELQVARALAQNSCDYFVAVGSGSLNDIVKYAAYLAGKPYIIFGTAPSMNGYCSPNASLLDGNYKKSFAARAPESVYLDLEILRAAPKRLINSGIGDCICRTTVQTDVMLSAQIKNTPLYAEFFALLKSEEEKIFDNIEALSRTLIYGGLVMLLAGSSAPASQGEHMLAHYMELMQSNAPESYHGEQISVTTLTMVGLQEKLLHEKDFVDIGEIDAGKITAHFTGEFGKYCLRQTQSKYKTLTGRKIKVDKTEIEKTILNTESLRKKLQLLNAPIKPADIGWNAAIYDNAQHYAKYTRDRFTFLDLI